MVLHERLLVGEVQQVQNELSQGTLPVADKYEDRLGYFVIEHRQPL